MLEIENLAFWLPPAILRLLASYLPRSIPSSYHEEIKNIRKNLSPYFPPSKIESIWREMLALELRLRFETVFIRKQRTQSTFKSFSSVPPSLPAPCVIVSAHLFNYWLLIEFLALCGSPVIFLIGSLSQRPKTPLERAVQKMLKEWVKMQKFIVREQGHAFANFKRALEKGERVLLLLDVPASYNFKEVTFLGKKIRVPERGLKFALQRNIPIFLIFPRVSSPQKPYELFMEFLPPQEKKPWNYIFKRLEKIVLSSPASWLGWTYLHLF